VDENYRIGIEDELQISVWHEPELSLNVVVRPDGMITLPLVNDVSVAGLSTKELQNLLTEKLKPAVTDPQVTIIVRGIRSRTIYLVGQVARPGAFPLNTSKTVFQMLVEAGGLSPFAKPNAIYVLRKTASGQQKLRFSYKKAVKGDSAQDIKLLPGDMIVVP
jgi:polysaccharide export outer membrane protein